MLLHIPQVFTKDEVGVLRAKLDGGPWADGNMTSGHQAATAKRNLQLPEECDVAREVSALVVQALNANPMFVAAALPHTIFPPLFNRYEGGGQFGTHVDNAIRQQRGGAGVRIRSDLSATLFLSEPGDYDGGELVLLCPTGERKVRLEAGGAVVYPTHYVHRVEPVTLGRRLAVVTWMQSRVRDHEERQILYDLATAIRALPGETGSAERLRLHHVFTRLYQKWATV